VAGEVHRLESELWQTTSLLLVVGGEAVAVDPGVTPAEIEGVRETAEALGGAVGTVLVTHSHFDHVCGIGAFPAAEAVMGSTTVAEVESGRAADGLARASAARGLTYRGTIRCDRSLTVGKAHRVGPFEVETFGLLGHSSCGVAFRVRSLDLLIVGDHVSSAEFPFVYESTAAYRATLAGLIDLLRRDPPELVAPGHGPLLEARVALEVAEADLEYLHALRRAVAAALPDGEQAAAAAGLALEPPRPAWPDLYEDSLRANVAAQLDELRPANGRDPARPA
jgi:glyoxylase-like metal-dependent hydrolase (beta-lactamase superfamily II)